MNQENRADLNNIIEVIKQEHAKWRLVGRFPGVEDYEAAIREWLEDGLTPQESMEQTVSALGLELADSEKFDFRDSRQ